MREKRELWREYCQIETPRKFKMIFLALSFVLLLRRSGSKRVNETRELANSKEEKKEREKRKFGSI